MITGVSYTTRVNAGVPQRHKKENKGGYRWKKRN